MKTSVIIAVYNEEDVIGQCLVSIADQSVKDYEVIVVDDGSTDNTKPEIEKFLKKNKNGIFFFLGKNHLGPGAARNLGAVYAKGEILVFVDADMSFDRRFLEMLTKPIIKGKTIGTFSKDEYVSNWENVWARCWNINEGWEEKRRHPKNYPDKQKVFRAIKKDIFLSSGGFTPGGYTDDYSLYQKIGKMAINAPGAVFYHKNPSSLKEVFLHAKWVSKREYKLGIVGRFYTLFKVNLIFSLLIGVYKSVKSKTPQYILFKVFYDTGIFFGIVTHIVTRKGFK
jgi:glycosyltransferase involved in cell wall biosynthesis